MRRTLLLVTVILVLVKVSQSSCGMKGCSCGGGGPNGGCCPGHTCGYDSRCCEIVTLRDEFAYPYPYEYGGYGYTESGVPGFHAYYGNLEPYLYGSAATGQSYVGRYWRNQNKF